MVDVEILKHLIPLINLSDKNLEKLASQLEPENFEKGSVIVEQGDTDNDAIYLIDGGVDMIAHGTTLSTVIQGGTDEATSPIAHSRPRQFTVKATTDVTILRLDNASLDRMVLLDELTTSITQLHPLGAKKFEGDSEWLEEMLKNKAFSRLAESQLAPLVIKMEPHSFSSGEILTKQGEVGDFYYVIKEGKVNVSRRGDDGKVKILATLKEGDVFGEESLITGNARNANIVAMGDVVVMKLAKNDFDELLKEPLIAYVDKSGAQEVVSNGGQILDVRSQAEFKKGALKGSINIPMVNLRANLDKLDTHKVYVICCRTDIQSEVAAFVMSQNGFDTRVLKGGLVALQ